MAKGPKEFFFEGMAIAFLIVFLGIGCGSLIFLYRLFAIVAVAFVASALALYVAVEKGELDRSIFDL